MTLALVADFYVGYWATPFILLGASAFALAYWMLKDVPTAAPARRRHRRRR